jgi:hypothetical protein
MVVFEGTLDPVVAHAIGESCDAESDVRRSWSIHASSKTVRRSPESMAPLSDQPSQTLTLVTRKPALQRAEGNV